MQLFISLNDIKMEKLFSIPLKAIQLFRIVVVAGFVFLDCGYHQEIKLDATLYLTIENYRGNAITVRYIKPLRPGFNDVPMAGGNKINLLHGSLTIESLEKTHDTITYEISTTDYCYLEENTAKMMRVDVDIIQFDTLYLTTSIYPWDTTTGTGEIVSNCYNERWDTLKIE